MADAVQRLSRSGLGEHRLSKLEKGSAATQTNPTATRIGTVCGRWLRPAIHQREVGNMTEDLTWLPAWRIAALVAAREVSPIEVTQHFLDRIEKLDSTLHAFAHLDAAGALEQAKRAEDDVANGETLGTLHGVPFAVMEMTRVKGMPSIPWGSESCSADDLVVERLRAAGAIVVGTTNSYYFKPEDRPRNPWNLDRDTGNSSRGSAAAVSGGLLPFTLAQDGAGSTRLPAAWNGLLGLHPSRGLIPHINYEKPGLLFGVSVGPITRDARDAAVITQAIAARTAEISSPFRTSRGTTSPRLTKVYQVCESPGPTTSDGRAFITEKKA